MMVLALRSGVIAIDGPAGAGKTTLGHWLADKFDLLYVETGYIYRAATHLAITQGLRPDRWDERLLEGLKVIPRLPMPRRREQRLLINGRDLDVEADLFSSEVDELVVRVSSNSRVRAAVRLVCRELLKEGKIIMSGRDVGSAIVPEADYKLFLTADAKVRAARLGRPHRRETDDERVPEIEPVGRRQEQEARLLRGHLRPPADALVIDTTLLSIADVRVVALRHLGING